MRLHDAIKQARSALASWDEFATEPGRSSDAVVAACRDLVAALDTTRVRRMPELMGSAEACELLGVKSGNLRQLAGLPEPVADLKATSVWLGSSLRAYAEVLEERRAARES